MEIEAGGKKMGTVRMATAVPSRPGHASTHANTHAYETNDDPCPRPAAAHPLYAQIQFELFMKECPRTAENFRQHCTGQAGKSKTTGKPLDYAGLTFHRIIPGARRTTRASRPACAGVIHFATHTQGSSGRPAAGFAFLSRPAISAPRSHPAGAGRAGFMVQGGDPKGDGSGGESIYGANFRDENFFYKNKEGYLSMANSGPNTNGSQFFVLLKDQPHLNNKHVVFGRVFRGMETLREIERFGTKDGKPKEKVVIARCGEARASSFAG